MALDDEILEAVRAGHGMVGTVLMRLQQTNSPYLLNLPKGQSAIRLIAARLSGMQADGIIAYDSEARRYVG